MRNITPANQAALEQRALVARDFISFFVRNRDTGVTVLDSMWSGIGQVQANIIDPDSGAIVQRNFFGSGTLIAIDDIPLVSNLSIQHVTIRMSQLSDRVNDLIRLYEPKQGRVQIFRGLFSPIDNIMVAPAEPRFVGFIDTIEIETPAEGEDGSVTLTCASHLQEITRSNPSYRSAEDQKLRNPNDSFFDDAATVGEWEMSWGKKANGKIGTSRQGRVNIRTRNQ